MAIRVRQIDTGAINTQAFNNFVGTITQLKGQQRDREITTGLAKIERASQLSLDVVANDPLLSDDDKLIEIQKVRQAARVSKLDIVAQTGDFSPPQSRGIGGFLGRLGGAFDPTDTRGVTQSPLTQEIQGRITDEAFPTRADELREQDFALRRGSQRISQERDVRAEERTIAKEQRDIEDRKLQRAEDVLGERRAARQEGRTVSKEQREIEDRDLRIAQDVVDERRAVRQEEQDIEDRDLKLTQDLIDERRAVGQESRAVESHQTAQRTERQGFRDEGFTEEDANRALRIGAGLEPRETAVTPSQELTQARLDLMKDLQSKVADGTASDRDIEDLRKIQVGVSPVQITLGQPASASERTAIAEGRASLDALTNLEVLFDNPKTETGPVKGRISPVAGLVGATTDEQESFMAATSAFKNQVIKDITGAQMSEKEAERIMKQIPDITDPPARWRAKFEQTQKNLVDIQKRREEVLAQSGLRVPTARTPNGQAVPGSELPQTESSAVDLSTADDEALDLAFSRARRRLPTNATEEEIFELAKSLLEAELSEENVNRK